MTTAAQTLGHALRRNLPYGPLVFLLVWEIAARAFSDAFVLAGPWAVSLYLFDNFGLIARALGVTLSNAVLGFFIGNASAVGLAVMAELLPRGEAKIRRIALLLICLPLLASGQHMRVFFGPGEWPQIILAALAVYYTTLIPLLFGLRAVPSGWLDLSRSYGRGRFSALVHIRAMAAVPYLVCIGPGFLNLCGLAPLLLQRAALRLQSVVLVCQLVQLPLQFGRVGSADQLRALQALAHSLLLLLHLRACHLHLRLALLVRGTRTGHA